MYSQAPEAGIASLLASRGRKGDSMLVHMAPEEVQGLQSLAYAAGGQLSVNPVTGLYEANFLKKLLPTLLGFGLSFIPGVGPLMAAGLVGAGETIRTGGDLGKGLMAGLGAFGGAGLGSGLAAAGKAGTEAALTGVTPAGALPGSSLAKYSLPQLPGAAAAGTETAKQGLFGTVQQGIEGLGTKAGREAFMGAIPGGTTGIAAGGMGLANALTPDVKFPDAMGQVDDTYYESEGYDPVTGTFRGGRFRKGYPGMPPRGMAEGGDVPPPAPSYDTNLADYMSQLNQFVTSPVAPPRPAAPPPAATAPPGAGGNVVAGGELEWDPSEGRFVRRGGVGGMPGDIDYNQLRDLFGGGFGSGFGNLNFDALQDYLQGGEGGARRWDADQGRFVSDTPAAPTTSPAATQPSPDTVYAGGTPGFYDQGMDFSAFDPGFNQNRLGNEMGTPAMPGRSTDFITPSMERDVFMGGTPNFDESMMDFQPDRQITPEAIQQQMGNINPFAAQPPAPVAPPPGVNPLSARRAEGFEDLPSNQPTLDLLRETFGRMSTQPPPPPMAPPQMPAMPPQIPPGMNPFAAQPPMAPPPIPQMAPPQMAPPQQAAMMDPYAQYAQMAGLGSINPMMFRQGGNVPPMQYAAGGKFLKGPGDGMSDDIKANINGQQEARLADGEFVVPADVVSHLGNGSSNAGSRKLYDMMAKVRNARTGTKKQAPAVKVNKYLPA